MKKKNYVYAIMLFLCAACIEDATNETFRQLNDVTIGGIEDKYENVYVDKDFRIEPTIKTALNKEDALSYVWIVYDKSTRYEPDTLSTEKNLSVKIHLIPGEHTLKFKVTDTSTAIFYEKEFTIHVVNEFTNGLMILAETEGKAMLDFWIPEKDEVVTDVYGKLNKNEVLGYVPQRIFFNKYRSDAVSEVLVLCRDDNGGRVLDNITLTRRKDYKDLFFGGAPATMIPQAYYRTSMREYLVDNGIAYDRAINTNPPSATVKPGMIAADPVYSIAANADFGDNEEKTSRIVLYDNKNTCFYALQNIASASLTKVTKTNGFTYVPGGFFSPDNVGMACLYAGITSRSASGAREYLGIFETQEGERRLLKMGIGFFVTGATPSSYFKDLANTVMTSEGINTATSFATSPLVTGYLFYASGSKIYLYNSVNAIGEIVYDFGENHTIDHIEMDRGEARLWVAFRNGTLPEKQAGFCGLNVETDGGFRLNRTVYHDRVADKIVDFERKY